MCPPEIDLCGDVPTGCERAVNLRVAAGALELGLTRPIQELLRRRGPTWHAAREDSSPEVSAQSS